MVNFITDLIEQVLGSKAPAVLQYAFFVLGILLVIIFLVIAWRMGRIISLNSNHTLRHIDAQKTAHNGMKLKRFGQYAFWVNAKKESFWHGVAYNNRMALERAGAFSPKALVIVIALKWGIMPAFTLLVMALQKMAPDGQPIMYGLMTFVVTEGGILFVIEQAKRKESDKFKTASYAMFKFLRNQISAGIKVPNALAGLYMVVGDPILKERLVLMSSHYASTNDIDKALSYITDFYPTMEAKSLALSIKQAIQTGKMDVGFEQKERKLFNMYLNVIKLRTQRLMLNFTIIAAFYALVVILMIGYPQVLDLIHANQMLFGR